MNTFQMKVCNVLKLRSIMWWFRITKWFIRIKDTWNRAQQILKTRNYCNDLNFYLSLKLWKTIDFVVVFITAWLNKCSHHKRYMSLAFTGDIWTLFGISTGRVFESNSGMLWDISIEYLTPPEQEIFWLIALSHDFINYWQSFAILCWRLEFWSMRSNQKTYGNRWS